MFWITYHYISPLTKRKIFSCFNYCCNKRNMVFISF
nr:MAG TPA: hypothetical protein [Caudoviricetes sp.]